MICSDHFETTPFPLVNPAGFRSAPQFAIVASSPVGDSAPLLIGKVSAFIFLGCRPFFTENCPPDSFPGVSNPQAAAGIFPHDLLIRSRDITVAQSLINQRSQPAKISKFSF